MYTGRLDHIGTSPGRVRGTLGINLEVDQRPSWFRFHPLSCNSEREAFDALVDGVENEILLGRYGQECVTTAREIEALLSPTWTWNIAHRVALWLRTYSDLFVPENVLSDAERLTTVVGRFEHFLDELDPASEEFLDQVHELRAAAARTRDAIRKRTRFLKRVGDQSGPGRASATHHSPLPAISAMFVPSSESEDAAPGPQKWTLPWATTRAAAEQLICAALLSRLKRSQKGKAPSGGASGAVVRVLRSQQTFQQETLDALTAAGVTRMRTRLLESTTGLRLLATLGTRVFACDDEDLLRLDRLRRSAEAEQHRNWLRSLWKCPPHPSEPNATPFNPDL